MSQATELLNAMTEEQMSLYETSTATEEHITINADRTITVPKTLHKIAVQYDHNAETVMFDCPRYWDGCDLSSMVFYIVYAPPKSTTPISYITNDVTIDEEDPNVMHFSWCISRAMTENYGPISFIVCAKTTDEDGNETIRWNSEINKDLYISPGMESNASEDSGNVHDMATWLLQYVSHITSAYDVAVKNGFEGTEEEWLLSLKGEKGDTGATGAQGPRGEQGPRGYTGDTGPQGPKGDPGEQGTGVTILGSYSTYNELISEHPTGNIGDGYLVEGYLYVWIEVSGAWENVGNIKGPKGDKGDTGPQGIPGTALRTRINAETQMWEYQELDTNGNPVWVSSDLKAVGPKGDTGATGPKGEDGATGPKGEDGKDGAQGRRGTGILKVSTSLTSYTTAVGGKNPIKRMSLSTIKSEAGVSEVVVGDLISYSYYLYHIYYIDSSYAYADTYVSIRGATGSAGAAGKNGNGIKNIRIEEVV